MTTPKTITDFDTLRQRVEHLRDSYQNAAWVCARNGQSDKPGAIADRLGEALMKEVVAMLEVALEADD